MVATAAASSRSRRRRTRSRRAGGPGRSPGPAPTRPVRRAEHQVGSVEQALEDERVAARHLDQPVHHLDREVQSGPEHVGRHLGDDRAREGEEVEGRAPRRPLGRPSTEATRATPSRSAAASSAAPRGGSRPVEVVHDQHDRAGAGDPRHVLDEVGDRSPRAHRGHAEAVEEVVEHGDRCRGVGGAAGQGHGQAPGLVPGRSQAPDQLGQHGSTSPSPGLAPDRVTRRPSAAAARSRATSSSRPVVRGARHRSCPGRRRGRPPPPP